MCVTMHAMRGLHDAKRCKCAPRARDFIPCNPDQGRVPGPAIGVVKNVYGLYADDAKLAPTFGSSASGSGDVLDDVLGDILGGVLECVLDDVLGDVLDGGIGDTVNKFGGAANDNCVACAAMAA